MVANSEANYIRSKVLRSATTLDMLEAESNLKNDQASLSHEKSTYSTKTTPKLSHGSSSD